MHIGEHIGEHTALSKRCLQVQNNLWIKLIPSEGLRCYCCQSRIQLPCYSLLLVVLTWNIHETLRWGSFHGWPFKNNFPGSCATAIICYSLVCPKPHSFLCSRQGLIVQDRMVQVSSFGTWLGVISDRLIQLLRKTKYAQLLQYL